MRLAQRILAEKRAFVLPLGVTLVLNLLVYAGVVYPLGVSVARAEARAEAAARALATAIVRLDNARAALTGKASADEELYRFYNEVLPADLAGARRLTYLRLAELAEEAGLQYERRQARETRDRDSQLARLETTMVLRGDYHDVRRFIHALETDQAFVVIDHVSLSQPDDQQLLTLSIDVSTYYRAVDGR